MTNLLAGIKCEVCNEEDAVGVASLPFAAYSAAFGKNCLKENAYPIWTLFYLYEDVANFNDEHLIPEVKEYKSFHEGKYITWDEMKVVADKTREERRKNDQQRTPGET